jgi:hypothetical protein
LADEPQVPTSQTRNPAKYNHNAARNRLGAIEAERRKIQTNAVRMAQRLAAIHDPSGVKFNVEPVTTLDDGRVVTLESIERKKARKALRRAQVEAAEGATVNNGVTTDPQEAADKATALAWVGSSAADRLNPERMALIESKMPQNRPSGLSKTQQKEMEQNAPRPPPPKPTIPDDIEIPEDEPEDWIKLWDLPDEELERRVVRAKRRAAREKKELRMRRKMGKAERRAAREEKRRVYRDLKQTWKVFREQERTRRKFLLSMEDRERKKLATEVTNKNRRDAMKACEELGFTLHNVKGVTEIQPRALGTKGLAVDFSKVEFVGDTATGLRVLAKEAKREKPKGNRVDRGALAPESVTQTMYGPYNTSGDPASLDQNFVVFEELGDESGHHHGQLCYNHKLRRKLRRAMEAAQVKKELLVREAAIKHFEENNIEVPPVLRTSAKPENIRGQRTMPDGTLESAKQERVRKRVELREFNKNAKILRAQAKERAIEAGIRIYLELMGRIPKRNGLEDEPAVKAAARIATENGQKVVWTGGGMSGGKSMADLLAGWPMPEDEFADYEGMHVYRDNPLNEPFEESSDDSAAKQLQAEMADSWRNDAVNAYGRVSSSREKDSGSEDEDYHVEMSDVS